MKLEALFVHAISTIKDTYTMIKQSTQRITLISLHSCLKDGSTEVYVLSLSLSISIDDAVRSL